MTAPIPSLPGAPDIRPNGNPDDAAKQALTGEFSLDERYAKAPGNFITNERAYLATGWERVDIFDCQECYQHCMIDSTHFEDWRFASPRNAASFCLCRDRDRANRP